jgi:hypothetical protein
MKFNSILGFGFSFSCNASYYVIDHGASRAYILNDDWSYVSYKNFTNPAYMISIGSSIYMTGSSNIWKLDKELNILIQYNSTGSTSPLYRGIYFNSSNGFIIILHNPYIMGFIIEKSFQTGVYQKYLCLKFWL